MHPPPHGEGVFLGAWGASDRFRCRDCGWDWSWSEPSEDDSDDDGRFASDGEADENAVSGDDWDGQPDEAQEWHDFDPDC